MKKIALDIDDVLAAFAPDVHRVFGVEDKLVPHNHWGSTDITGKLMLKTDKDGNFLNYTQKYLDECEHNEKFWGDLPILSLPYDIDFDVACYITSSPRNMVNIRREWLRKNGFPLAPVVHCTQKEVTMQRLGIDILVDDKLATVEKVNSIRGLHAVHFKAWYCNVETEGTITNLRELDKYL